MGADPASFRCPNCRAAIGADTKFCALCDASFDRPDRSSLKTGEAKVVRQSKTVYLLNALSLTFPLWGTFIAVKLSNSMTDDGSLADLTLALAVLSAAPIIMINHLSVIVKIVAVVFYYMVAAVVMLFVVLAVGEWV